MKKKLRDTTHKGAAPLLVFPPEKGPDPYMEKVLYKSISTEDIPIVSLSSRSWDEFSKTLSSEQKAWAQTNNFEGKPKQICLLPNKEGALAFVLWGEASSLWASASLASSLPKGNYKLDDSWQGDSLKITALAWGLESYTFDHYKSEKKPSKGVFLGLNEELKVWASEWVKSISLTRDLINTPAEDLNPETLAQKAQELSQEYRASCHLTVGDALLKNGFRGIYTVGRAGKEAPRLIDFTWGDKKNPHVILVGKGVCFDSGGLDLKPPAGMRTMKKDMGGAAQVLGLARHIMQNKLPVCLRVLIPAVENGIDTLAYRPGDVIKTYSGKTVEVDNTDAEGRLVLADALSLACEEKCDLLLDFATLTGAGRVALGTDLPALFSQDDALAKNLIEVGDKESDHLWRLPLYESYNDMIRSDIADIKNCGDTPYGGAITAALFLQNFVKPETPWAHFDLMAFNTKSSPGKPKGGEAMGIRAAYAVIEKMSRKSV